MRAAGVGEIIVVTGGHESAVRKEALRLGCLTVHNPAYKSGMLSSAAVGINAVSARTEAFFLLPSDSPLVKTFTYKFLVNSFYETYGNPNVVFPNFMGKRGNPVLIGREMIDIQLPIAENGLFAILEDRGRIHEARVADRGVTMDMNTPEDYETTLDYAKREKFPDDDECLELTAIAGTPNKVIRHMNVVCESAMRITAALKDKGIKINRELLRSACLLHDIAKGDKEHEARGARWLRERGYARVAKLVASHKDLPAGTEKKVPSEAEILYLADKITDGEATAGLKHRMARLETRLAPGSDSLLSSRRRFKQAMEIQKRVEKITGRSLDELVDLGKR
jgi:CTP:molybdopterin cytidylyltransferase MocA/HD superfamily phosphohydrolase YqeK